MMRSLGKIGLVLLSAAPSPAGEAIYGLWAREGHSERLVFFDCDGQLCAKSEFPSPDGSPPPLIIRHAQKTAPNEWKGQLFNPENGKLYSGSVTLNSRDQLTLTGCLISFLCQSETWTRVKASPPAKPRTK